MKLAVLIPDRGDRPELLKNCLRMMQAQSLRPDHIEIVDFAPTDNKVDITKRYRIGYEKLSRLGFDLIAFIENDDWYSPRYLWVMMQSWESCNRPDIIGTTSTIYYHIGIRKWFTMNHVTRSSAMSTMIRGGLDLKWCEDHDPYADIALWAQLDNRVLINTAFPICLGIKHGEGLCGGENHATFMHRYINDDYSFKFLRATLDSISFDFYSKYHEIHCNRAQRGRERE